MAHELPPAAVQDLGWPDFQAPPPATSALPLDNNNIIPSWISDDFDEFSTAKRRAHHRPPSFDEEAQLIMSMFDNEQIKDAASDGPTNSSSGPAASSSVNDKKRCRQDTPPEVKTEHEEVESSACKDGDTHGAPPVAAEEGTVSPPLPAAGSPDTVSDPKRVKRILANRQSARRSRVRKLQYISELERNLTTLQTEVSMLSPRVQYLDHQRLILNADNSTLKSKIAALAQENIFKDAHQEALRREIERLKQIYQQQQNINTTPTSSPPSSAQAPTPN